MIAFDIETNGLLDKLTTIHCINAIDVETGREYRFTDHATYLDATTGEDTGEPAPRDGTIEDGLKLLAEADDIIAHNAVGFDIPAILIVHPNWKAKGRIHDSRVYSALIWTDLKERDFAGVESAKLPVEFRKGALIGSHSLKAWGMRLGLHKGDFDPKTWGRTWEDYPFSRECDDYCIQDVRVLVALWQRIVSKGYSAESLELEMDVARIIQRQEDHGFLFDVDAAERLAAELTTRRAELEEECRSLFDAWYAPDGNYARHENIGGLGLFVPKRDHKGHGYLAGVPVTKIKQMVFNPGSRAQIADRLATVYGWQPTEFTPTGQPQVDESSLEGLDFPACGKLLEYLKVGKRLGQLAEGKEAWLKAVKDDGRIRGRVNTNGAVTGRMTHAKPNVAQVDKFPPMRALWTVPAGYKLVGCDADGLELRMLGHYMAALDNGDFAHAVVEGRKEDGTDAHSRNQKGAGLNHRDSAKTLIYALIYGAGDEKIGQVVYDDMTDTQRAKFDAAGGDLRELGKRRRARLMKALPALKRLIQNVKARAQVAGHLRGLDGRLLHIRSAHKAPNTLLQSGGAVVMKKALVLLDKELQDEWGLVPGLDYEFVANVHDEFQIEVAEAHADLVGQVAALSIKKAGEHFNLRCPLAGSFDIGSNWSETH